MIYEFNVAGVRKCVPSEILKYDSRPPMIIVHTNVYFNVFFYSETRHSLLEIFINIGVRTNMPVSVHLIRYQLRNKSKTLFLWNLNA